MTRPQQQVRLVDFSCRYGRGAPLRLQHVSLDVHAGEFVAIAGPSGGGKSTLGYSLNGIVPHEIKGSETAGDVLVGELRVSDHPPHELARMVGSVLQDPEWQLVTFTVRDEIAFALENLGLDRHEIDRRVSEAGGALGLVELLDRSPDQLSGGEKQRVAIAACMALQPRVLLLDEPLAEVDPAGKRQVLDAVTSLHRERSTTVLLIDHNLELVAPRSDRMIVVANGGIEVDASPRSPRVWSTPAGLKPPQALEIAALVRWPAPAPRPLSMSELAGEVSRLGLGPGRAAVASEVESATSQTVIEAEGLRFRYPSGQQAITDVDLVVREGELIGVAGPNGAGKSTLAKLLVGLLRPQAGRVSVRGVPLERLRRSELARRIGYVFQDPDYQFFRATCFEEVAFGLRLHGLAERDVDRRVMDSLDALGVAGCRDEHPHFLSRGQRRRVAIATVLAMEPDVLILDEPTSGVDGRTADRLLDTVEALRRRAHAVLLLTHEMRPILERCSRLLVVHDGQLKADGDPRALFGEASRVRRFGLEPPPLTELFGRLWPPSPSLLPRTSADAARLLASEARMHR